MSDSVDEQKREKLSAILDAFFEPWPDEETKNKCVDFMFEKFEEYCELVDD